MTLTKYLTLAMGLFLAIVAPPIPVNAAPAVPSLPATTTWTDAGLREMVRMSGPISVSIDGAGFQTQTGTIDVDKPANSTVIAAYLVSSVWGNLNTPPVVKLGGSSVSFTHLAKDDVGSTFRNHFADVTNIVKPIIDAAPTGITQLTLDEGITDSPTAGTPGTSRVDGESLIVIFDDPAKPVSTVMIMFGFSNSSGDSFTFNFDPLINLSMQKPVLSLGISFSNQSADRTQHSEITVTTSSNVSTQTVSVTAGDCDDGLACSTGSMITVGGIGDSLDLPANSSADDDELYGLTSFLAAGDTSLTVNTRNPTADDNLFQSVLYFEGVAVTGAPSVGSAPQVVVTPAPPSNNPAQNTPTVAEQGSSSSSLAATGGGYTLPMFALAGGAVLLGILGLVLVRRRRS